MPMRLCKAPDRFKPASRRAPVCQSAELLPARTVTPLSPGRGGRARGAAGVRVVCGPESDMPCPPCVCFITPKAKLKKKKIILLMIVGLAVQELGENQR